MGKCTLSKKYFNLNPIANSTQVLLKRIYSHDPFPQSFAAQSHLPFGLSDVVDWPVAESFSESRILLNSI